jgi:hypothetical protein
VWRLLQLFGMNKASFTWGMISTGLRTISAAEKSCTSRQNEHVWWSPGSLWLWREVTSKEREKKAIKRIDSNFAICFTWILLACLNWCKKCQRVISNQTDLCHRHKKQNHCQLALGNGCCSNPL